MTGSQTGVPNYTKPVEGLVTLQPPCAKLSELTGCLRTDVYIYKNLLHNIYIYFNIYIYIYQFELAHSFEFYTCLSLKRPKFLREMS